MKGNLSEQLWVDMSLPWEEMETQSLVLRGSPDAQRLYSDNPELHVHAPPADRCSATQISWTFLRISTIHLSISLMDLKEEN